MKGRLPKGRTGQEKQDERKEKCRNERRHKINQKGRSQEEKKRTLKIKIKYKTCLFTYIKIQLYMLYVYVYILDTKYVYCFHTDSSGHKVIVSICNFMLPIEKFYP